jgi:hypothetical protein
MATGPHARDSAFSGADNSGAGYSGAGYSGTPLVRKLGIKPGHRVALVDPPTPFSLPPLEGVTVARAVRGSAPYDVLLVFCPHESALVRRFVPMTGRIVDNGALWIAWPKKASGVTTDLTETVVRKHGLANGLVDVKVCAIDATWSGLKFVYRLADRAPRPHA